MADFPESYESFRLKFQRAINRVNDKDRNTRKRGLQSLLDELPWNDEFQSDHMQIMSQDIFGLVVTRISDPVEKCRELSLCICEKLVMKCQNHEQLCSDLVKTLCSRIGETPFPESAEEIRLQVIKVLYLVCTHPKLKDLILSSYSTIIPAIGKVLLDSFPSVKKDAADLLYNLTQSGPVLIRLHFKSVLRGLTVNAVHQHSKVRVSTIKALEGCLCCVTEEFPSVMKETLVHLFNKIITDNSALVRLCLTGLCGSVLAHRCRLGVDWGVKGGAGAELSLSTATGNSGEVELMKLLLQLAADPAPEVAERGVQGLQLAGKAWMAKKDLIATDNGAIPMETEQSEGGDDALRAMLAESASVLASDLLDDGLAHGWTKDSRVRAFRGLRWLLRVLSVGKWGEETVTPLLPPLFDGLAPYLQDEEADVRLSCENCCQCVGESLAPAPWTEFLTARVKTIRTSGTESQKGLLFRLLAPLLRGYFARPDAVKDDATSSVHGLVFVVCESIAQPDLFQDSSETLREAVLLLIRSIIDACPTVCCSPTAAVAGNLCLSLSVLRGGDGGDVSVVVEAAARELIRLARLHSSTTGGDGTDGDEAKLLSRYFTHCMSAIKLPASGRWTTDSPHKAAFETLVRLCPEAAWQHRDTLAVIAAHIQPPGSETDEALQTLQSTRMSFLSLLGGLLRAGAADWRCGAAMKEASAKLLEDMLLPNLVWKAGRAEAAIRKVSMTASHALLKAGGIDPEILYRMAPRLVPALVAQLDDHDESGRLLACLCVGAVLVRLKGAFGDQAVREMYPALLKRLDDSSDKVRLAICPVLEVFFASAAPECFRGTPLDYMVDIFLVHLDDPDTAVQESVLKVLRSAMALDAGLVQKKAENSRISMRSPALIDRLLGSSA